MKEKNDNIIKEVISKLYYCYKSILMKCVSFIPPFCGIFFIAFIGFLIWSLKKFSNTNSLDFINYFELSAYIVTIFSMILVLLQLISYVVDNRENLKRNQKEYSVSLSEKYAKEIIPEMSFIKYVLQEHYGETNFKKVIEINPIEFDSQEAKSLLPCSDFMKPFESGTDVIKYETIDKYSKYSNRFDINRCRAANSNVKKKNIMTNLEL